MLFFRGLKVVSGFEEMGGTTSTHGSRDQMLYCVVSCDCAVFFLSLRDGY